MAGVEGLEKVMSELHKKSREIKGASVKGMLRAIIQLRRDMEFTAPTIPIDLGNLRASWFVIRRQKEESTGFSSGQFEGDEQSRMAAQHSNVMSRAQSMLDDYSIIFGFSAYYAAYVHEATYATFKPPTRGRRGQPGAKFMEAAIARNKNKMLEIIRKNAIIK